MGMKYLNTILQLSSYSDEVVYYCLLYWLGGNLVVILCTFSNLLACFSSYFFVMNSFIYFSYLLITSEYLSVAVNSCYFCSLMKFMYFYYRAADSANKFLNVYTNIVCSPYYLLSS